MPTINLEMMKQLLEEFSEKEALTTEEINVIEKEISNLVQRIGFCHSRLQNLGADKEKLSVMKERYIKGNFPRHTQVASPELVNQNVLQPANSTPSNPVSAGQKSLNSVITSHPDIINSTPDKSEPQDTTHQSAAPSTTQPPTPPPANEEPSVPASGEEIDINKEGNEPIKSINEALKGLFRK